MASRCAFTFGLPLILVGAEGSSDKYKPPRGTAKCKVPKYPHCYNREFTCPRKCPRYCLVDCVACKPVCSCDKPGAVCEDPRFIGGDGNTFYYHGKKYRDFCLLSDPEVHINAHFIGKKNASMKRDFTWVQAIGVLFGDHQIYVGAEKTSTWDNTSDRLNLSFDGEPISLPSGEGAQWQSAPSSPQSPQVSINRARQANGVVMEIEGLLQIEANVVPITEEESRVHRYGITEEDCMAHLELAFKFYSLAGNVSGVLGQTYAAGYVSKVKMSAAMPIMGGDDKFASSDIFSTDCAVSQFGHGKQKLAQVTDLAGRECKSGGRGIVCKKWTINVRWGEKV